VIFFPAVKLPVDLGIPNIKDLVGDVAGAPFKWLLDVFHDWYNGLVKMFEEQYVHHLTIKPGPVTDYLFGSALNLSQYLASGAFMAALVLAAFLPSGMKRMPRTFKVLLGVIVAPTAYFWGLDLLTALGDQLSEAVVGIYTPTGKFGHQALLAIPIVDNPLGALTGMGFTLTFGGLLLGIFTVYAPLGLVAALLLLPFFALSALWDWAYKLTNIFISAVLVTHVLGIPVALFFLKIGQAASDNIGVINNSLGITMMINGGLILGIVAQVFLFWACMKVVSPVTGSIYNRGNSRVFGKVKAETSEKRKSDSSARRESYNRTFLNRRGSHTAPSQQSSGNSSTRQAARTGAVVLAKKYPATALVATAASSKSSSKNATTTSQPRSRNTGGSTRTGSAPPSRKGGSGGSSNGRSTK
jgi:hypothetical protein